MFLDLNGEIFELVIADFIELSDKVLVQISRLNVDE
uniref:Uncharacterized protein n=1 Tax=Lepeophtheirus salmonis TaxID=72036 RepID=A0A0K2UCC2_LEPSM